jgi:hypothetical protein
LSSDEQLRARLKRRSAPLRRKTDAEVYYAKDVKVRHLLAEQKFKKAVAEQGFKKPEFKQTTFEGDA